MATSTELRMKTFDEIEEAKDILAAAGIWASHVGTLDNEEEGGLAVWGKDLDALLYVVESFSNYFRDVE